MRVRGRAGRTSSVSSISMISRLLIFAPRSRPVRATTVSKVFFFCTQANGQEGCSGPHTGGISRVSAGSCCDKSLPEVGRPTPRISRPTHVLFLIPLFSTCSTVRVLLFFAPLVDPLAAGYLRITNQLDSEDTGTKTRQTSPFESRPDDLTLRSRCWLRPGTEAPPGPLRAP